MAIPTTIESLSTTAASNGPTGSEQRTIADDGLRQAYAFIRQLVTKGANIASATTITPPSTGSSFTITGTTTITTIASTNSWDGRLIALVFADAVTLTHSSNLSLPLSANITTVAGDTFEFLQTGSGAWKCISQNTVKTLRQLRVDSDPGYGGIWPDVTAATVIHRMRDRLFLGDGAATTGNRTGTQSGKVPTATEGASWASRDAQLFAFASTGLLAVTGFSRSSDQTDPAVTACIGASGFVINDKASGLAWGLYSDVQHESGATSSYGLEVAAKNKGSDTTGTPYGLGNGVEGARLVAGGDNAYGGSAANPSKAALVIVGGASTWNDGILFESGGLTITSTVSRAVSMGVGMRLYWYTSGNNKGFAIRSDNDTASTDSELVASENALAWYGANGKAAATLTHTPSGVNRIDLRSDVTLQAPSVRALGDDTNIDLLFTPKGSGVVRFGTHSAIGSETVTGYITIKDAAGNSRKVAVVS